MMRRLFAPSLLLALAVFVLGPASGLAASGSQSYQLHLELPNVSQASNGDRISVTGEGEFAIHPKSAEASGEFVHTDSGGTVLTAGTWTATDLLEFQPYGCGVVHNFPTPGATTPLPPNVCGGAVKMTVTLTPNGTSLVIPRGHADGRAREGDERNHHGERGVVRRRRHVPDRQPRQVPRDLPRRGDQRRAWRRNADADTADAVLLPTSHGAGPGRRDLDP